MEKIEMDILALTNSENQQNSFVVILKEKYGNRRLPVVIGGFEAQAIALSLQDIKPNRPMTHDLFKESLIALEVYLMEVIISDLQEAIFYATLVYLKPDGSILEVDSRTSDALALAVRFGASIYANAKVLDEAAIAVEGEGVTEEVPMPQPGSPLSSYTTKELEHLLEEALAGEDYEKAAQIRDELKRRSEKS
ncbi:MAG TPA: bifunctional nuclease family protein [Saprospiraceae bacterium]|nr:bifunctional nuclease family protein [Saprospiraceae bacterium]HMP23916.1 bifunctional nuclease family protein [Saprospiraceae bacterium]